MLIRYNNQHGWYHAELLKRGRKWVTVRDLFQSRRKRNGKYGMEYRVRKVLAVNTATALWGFRR